MATYDLRAKALILHPDDDIVIAKAPIPTGTVLDHDGDRLEVVCDVRPGHKIARRARGTGEAVRRYGQVIGFATQPIGRGEHVHTHNLAVGDYQREYEVGVDVRPVDYYPPDQMRYFDGFKRADGRVGTRNYLAVISTVNCSASVCQFIRERFRDVQRDFPNVDGVIAITHKSGCGTKLFGEDHEALMRVLGGYARHPNVGAYVLIGLGCEVNQTVPFIERQRLGRPRVLSIQEAGGVRKTVEAGIKAVQDLLPVANEARRTPQPLSELILATNCGGSDGNSGITANPALGWAVDELVRYGGTGVLAETPEIYGAEHLLTRRAVSREVGEKLVSRIRWWEDYCARNNAEMNNNPSAGNKAGGLTTILEKSLGAVAKGGTTNLVEVCEYAEPVTAKGLVFMDTPGYDPVTVTGQVGGGANLICFTTGRGSAFGFVPTPSLKLASNTALWQRQQEDIDLNCGGIIDGTATIDETGEEIFRLMLDCASGKKSKSELHGYGQNEFVPWQLSVVT